MASKCCSQDAPRKLRVGASTVRVVGVDQLLRQLFDAGWRPEQPALAEQLVVGLRAAGNFIARGSEPHYAQSLLALYHQFFEKHHSSSSKEFQNAESGGQK